MLLKRTNTSPVEVSADRRLSFYAAIYNAPTVIEERKRYTEVIQPGAFDLTGSGEVYANVNHIERLAFAKRSDGSLLLQSDAKGLFASTYLPNDEIGEMVMRAHSEGRVTGASFQATDVFSRTNGDTVERVKLFLLDVCVSIGEEPAYPQTKNEVILRTRNKTQTLFSLLNFQKWKLTR